MFCLDRRHPKPATTSKIAKKLLVDRTTARRAIKGRGKDHPLHKSLLGMEFVVEVKTGKVTEYAITEIGRQIVAEIKPVMSKMAGGLHDRITKLD